MRSRLRCARALSRMNTAMRRIAIVTAILAMPMTMVVSEASATASKHPVGSTQTVKTFTGIPYSVMLAKVLDPATPATRTFLGPKSGTRFVATEFTITNKGHETFTSDSNDDASVVGSNNQVYTWTFATVTECTNFDSGVFDLVPNASETGCVVFDIPEGVTVTRVIWASTLGLGSTVQWTVTVPTPGTTTPPSTPSPSHTFTTYTRIYGETAVATAAEELEHAFPAAGGGCVGATSLRSVIVATDQNYPDALAGSYLAGSLRTGTLLTAPASLSAPTITAIRTEGVTTVFVLGGPLAVSTAVTSELQSLTVYACGGTTKVPGKAMTVERIFGTTQYTTAEKVATSLASSLATLPTEIGSVAFPGAYSDSDAQGGVGRYNDTSGDASSVPTAPGALRTAILATGTGYQDAMAAGALAYAEHFPILLTTPTALSSQAASAIQALGIKQVIVMGGPLAISDAVVSSLQALGVSVLRIAGQNYMDTSVQLAEFETAPAPSGLGWLGSGSVTIARGDQFADGLAGGDIPGRAEEPLLLTQSPRVIGTALVSFLHAAGTSGIGGLTVRHFTILGGPDAVTQPMINQMGADL